MENCVFSNIVNQNVINNQWTAQAMAVINGKIEAAADILRILET